MNWINTLPVYQWLILGLIPPLIFLLYFLKLRRIPIEVPSTYLWTKTVEDMHVNDIWQRLRKNLLLFLQLLAMFLLMIACLRPGCQGVELTGDRFIFVVDQSASMSATDMEDGVTRLEEAKKQVINMIDRMKPNDVAMLISFSDRSNVAQSYTKNKSLLRRKTNAIGQTQRGSDINEALLAASGLANPGRTSDKESNRDIQVADALEAKLMIFSDGAVKSVPQFSLGNLTPEYFPIGAFEPPNNVGITAFSINDQMDISGQVQIFARLQNSSLEDTSVDVSLYIDDQLADARAGNNVPGLGSTSLQFDLTALMSGLEKATPIRLEIDNRDVYLQDNVAHCILNPPRLATVLIVSDYDFYLRLALTTPRMSKLAKVQFENRDYLKDKEFLERSALGFYDLVIFDQCSPEAMPLANTITWGSIPRLESWKTIENLETTPIADAENSHPLMFAVQMGDVNILSGQTLEGPPGSISLVDSAKGAVMMIAPRGGFQDLVIGFPLVTYLNDEININTDWFKKASFPVFMQNVVTVLGGNARFNASRANSPGAAVSIRPLLPYPAISVKDPQGQTTELRPRNDNSFVYSQTEESGVYEVRETGSGELDQLFAVNLLDRTESDLAVREELKLGYDEIAGTTEVAPARKEYWTWLVLVALIVISIEWFIYNRRVFI